MLLSFISIYYYLNTGGNHDFQQSNFKVKKKENHMGTCMCLLLEMEIIQSVKTGIETCIQKIWEYCRVY